MVELEKYTSGEKFANYFTHLVGVFLSIYGTVILVVNSKNTTQVIATMIYGVALFLLFLSSVFYHTVTNKNAIEFVQKLDHSAIYILIAGTYTPGLLFIIKFPLNFILLGIIWALAIVGIIFTCVTFKSKYLSTGLYLLMGWISLIFFNNAWTTSHLVVWLLLGGGVSYSIGCIFYLKKFLYSHSIWHLFVLAGAMMHYFAILELLKILNQS